MNESREVVDVEYFGEDEAAHLAEILDRRKRRDMYKSMLTEGASDFTDILKTLIKGNEAREDLAEKVGLVFDKVEKHVDIEGIKMSQKEVRLDNNLNRGLIHLLNLHLFSTSAFQSKFVSDFHDLYAEACGGIALSDGVSENIKEVVGLFFDTKNEGSFAEFYEANPKLVRQKIDSDRFFRVSVQKFLQDLDQEVLLGVEKVSNFRLVKLLGSSLVHPDDFDRIQQELEEFKNKT